MLQNEIVKDREHTTMEKRPNESVIGKNDSIVAILNTHVEAEEAVKELQKAGFDMKKLSIVARNYRGGFWGLLFGSAFFVVPGIGPILVGGPLVVWIIGALEGAAIVGGLSAVGAALYSLGIPKDTILKYESFLEINKFLVVAHGTTEQIDRARDILRGAGSVETNVHRGGHL